MDPECCPDQKVRRRHFLATSCGALGVAASASVARPSAPKRDDLTAPRQPRLPTVALGEHRVTRLIAGYNPIGGHSHTTRNLSQHMLEYFTAEQTASFLHHCERQGIDTWQYDHTDKVLEALRIARESGSRMQLICLHAERPHDAPLAEVMRWKPIAIVHHGGVTDRLFRDGRAGEVHDFVKKVHDAGALAGVSAHCPDHLKRIADEGWEVDLFMTCFYHLSRPRDEMLAGLGKVPVGEPFFESDPDEMIAVIREVDQPCLAFKILAAGRRCWNRPAVEQAFQEAFAAIKPADAVIVGMYPRFVDEVAENAAWVRQHVRA